MASVTFPPFPRTVDLDAILGRELLFEYELEDWAIQEVFDLDDFMLLNNAPEFVTFVMVRNHDRCSTMLRCYLEPLPDEGVILWPKVLRDDGNAPAVELDRSVLNNIARELSVERPMLVYEPASTHLGLVREHQAGNILG